MSQEPRGRRRKQERDEFETGRWRSRETKKVSELCKQSSALLSGRTKHQLASLFCHGEAIVRYPFFFFSLVSIVRRYLPLETQNITKIDSSFPPNPRHHTPLIIFFSLFLLLRSQRCHSHHHRHNYLISLSPSSHQHHQPSSSTPSNHQFSYH